MEDINTLPISIYGIDKPKQSIPELIKMGVNVAGVKDVVKKLGLKELTLKDCRDLAILYVNVYTIYYEMECHHIRIEGMDDIEKIIEKYKLYDIFKDDDRSSFRINPEYIPIVIDEFIGMM